MKQFLVSIEIDGSFVPVGELREREDHKVHFSYLESYLDRPDARPVSISLPLQEESFSSQVTKTYFDGLLPEGFARKTVAGWMHVSEEDYLSILYGLGKECLGAVKITDGNEEPVADYRIISPEEVRELAGEGITKSIEMVTKAHLSLTGASGKVGLYYDPVKDQWYLPRGTAASTHIVKQSHVRMGGIVTNEQLCMLAAGHCGIQVPESFIINTGRGGDGEILFASQRFDRMMPSEPETIKSLPCPIRLHQEDFAQALGISSTVKYEREPGEYLVKMFDLLRKYSKDPMEDQLKLWDRLIFDFLIGNTDAHIKNFSLLYNSQLQGIHLAPAYDLLSTVVYPGTATDMAIGLGDTLSIDSVTEESLKAAAGKAGMGEKPAMARYEKMCSLFEDAIKKAADELTDAGFPKAKELGEEILRCGGYARQEKGIQGKGS